VWNGSERGGRMSDEIYGYLAVLGAIFFFGSIGAALHQSFIEFESFSFF
jgi:hypothetical protein